MASMVAKPSCNNVTNASSSIIVQEIGSRNKRKFRADLPLGDLNKMNLSSQKDCSSYEFSAEKSEVISSHGHSNAFDLCSVRQDHFDGLKLDFRLSNGENPIDVDPWLPREDLETDEVQDADWSDFTESKLEELVLINLSTIFKGAIKKIVACGYTEEAATKAVSRSGICYGSKETVSNIVDNGLAFLKSRQEIEYLREHVFEDLQQLEKYVLAEMACVLREVRPFFSYGDTLWCLLICDMNVSHACAMDGDSFGTLPADGNSPSLQATKNSENLGKPNLPITCSHSPQSEASGFSNNSKSKNSLVNRQKMDKEGINSTSDSVDNKRCSAVGLASFASEGKIGGSKKFQSNTAKREYILRQKSLHMEKNYRTYGSKGFSRTGKLSGMDSLILDKKLTAVSHSTSINLKSASLKIREANGADVGRDNENHDLSTDALSSSHVVTNFLDFHKKNIQPEAEVLPSLAAADTELSLSLPTKCDTASLPISCNEASHGGHAGKQFDKSPRQWVPYDKKDDMILKLVPRVRELQNQLQEWNEWANQKVMQAARRLGKDKNELKTLRQEKEEVERLKKEKQALEESTMKKLSEMENALCKASGQVGFATSAVRRLEIENVSLRRAMEDAKLRAAESAANCQEVSKREKKTIMEFQSWGKQKTVLQEELVAEKRISTQLLIELEEASNLHEQQEAKWRFEEQGRLQLLTEATSISKEREQIEASMEAKQGMVRLKAENNLQKYKNDIQKLEKEISQLRQKSDSSRIAALKRGIDGSYASILSESRNTIHLKETRDRKLASSVNNLQPQSGKGSVKREHECVMCLTEEMSVVFLPCAHQVVCGTCNELHEKQGMKDCPSCRSPIQQRISVRFSRA